MATWYDDFSKAQEGLVTACHKLSRLAVGFDVVGNSRMYEELTLISDMIDDARVAMKDAVGNHIHEMSSTARTAALEWPVPMLDALKEGENG